MYVSEGAKAEMERINNKIVRSENFCEAWISKNEQCTNHPLAGKSFCGIHEVWFGNPDLYMKVNEYLKVGMLPDEALALCGVTPSIWSRWNREFKGHPVFDAFLENIYRLQYKTEAELLEQIKAHGERDWKAIQWILKTMRPDRYGDRARVDSFVTTGAPELDVNNAQAVIAHMLSSGKNNNNDEPEEETYTDDDEPPFCNES